MYKIRWYIAFGSLLQQFKTELLELPLSTFLMTASEGIDTPQDKVKQIQIKRPRRLNVNF